jgi:Family of unknown function (DUF6519)
VKGDFSDVRFDPLKHFSQVLQQQGRVQLDSDTNEQAAILLHYLRTLASDLIGPHGGPSNLIDPHGGPVENEGFKITPVVDSKKALVDLTIGPGRYYVDGILCELEERRDDEGVVQPLSYRAQPDYLLTQDDNLPEDLPFLVFLDVWERYVCAAEDDSIREVALGGPDTTGRAHVVWQVRVFPLQGGSGCDNFEPAFNDIVDTLQPEERGLLQARARRPEEDEGPCLVSPEARYRGEENQLYRVEIHRTGDAWNGQEDGGNAATAASFKFSRDNGSNVFPIVDFDGSVVTLEYLGRDERSDLQEGDLVEVQYEGWLLGDTRRTPSPPPLLEVEAIDRDTLEVTLTGDLGPVDTEFRKGAQVLRRWDRSPSAAAGASGVAEDGTVLVREDSGDTIWFSLERGIEVQFKPPVGGNGVYRSGDFWVIPARVSTGNIRWPRAENDEPAALPPQGVVHHYAPLAVILESADVGASADDCRCKFRTDCQVQKQNQ